MNTGTHVTVLLVPYAQGGRHLILYFRCIRRKRESWWQETAVPCLAWLVQVYSNCFFWGAFFYCTHSTSYAIPGTEISYTPILGQSRAAHRPAQSVGDVDDAFRTLAQVLASTVFEMKPTICPRICLVRRCQILFIN